MLVFFSRACLAGTAWWFFFRGAGRLGRRGGFFFAGRPGRDGVVVFFRGQAWPGRRVDFYFVIVPKINTPVVYFSFEIKINTPSAPKINTPPERWFEHQANGQCGLTRLESIAAFQG